jgi:hypothetical protein
MRSSETSWSNTLKLDPSSKWLFVRLRLTGMARLGAVDKLYRDKIRTC